MGESLERCRIVAAKHPGLRVLVLFGSRATGDARPDSDWDFAYLAAPEMDRESLRMALADALGVASEAVDLVDLSRASAVLRYEVARDLVAVVDTGNALESFVLAAAHQWFDMQPVLASAYRELLENVSR